MQGLEVWGSTFRVEGSGFLGVRVSCSGFGGVRVEGLQRAALCQWR